MDWRMPVFLLAAAGLGYWTWSANRSGKLTLKWSRITRDEYPRIFLAALVTQGLLALGAAILAIVAAFGLLPAISN